MQCHKKETTPRVMHRGSATTDIQFAYFTPCDSYSVYSYRWSTEKWEKLPSSPCSNSGLVIIDSELTAVGGYDGSDYSNKLFTLRQGQWVEHYPPMNTLRSSTAVVSTSDGNYILVIGGRVGVFYWIATVELFHVKSRRWYKLTNLPKSLTRPSATICDNQLYVIERGLSGYSCSLEALLSGYQPQMVSKMLTWTPVRLPQQTGIGPTVATLRGQLVIVGGEQNHFIYQLVDGQWVKISSLSSNMDWCFLVSPLPDKMMIVSGYGECSVEECIVV